MALQEVAQEDFFFFFSDSFLLGTEFVDRTRPCGLQSMGFVEFPCFVLICQPCSELSRAIFINLSPTYTLSAAAVPDAAAEACWVPSWIAG